jgi:hypothetical protein
MLCVLFIKEFRLDFKVMSQVKLKFTKFLSLLFCRQQYIVPLRCPRIFLCCSNGSNGLYREYSLPHNNLKKIVSRKLNFLFLAVWTIFQLFVGYHHYLLRDSAANLDLCFHSSYVFFDLMCASL